MDQRHGDGSATRILSERKSCFGVTMRVTIFMVYGGIHVVVYLDGKIERRMCAICFYICFS